RPCPRPRPRPGPSHRLARPRHRTRRPPRQRCARDLRRAGRRGAGRGRRTARRAAAALARRRLRIRGAGRRGLDGRRAARAAGIGAARGGVPRPRPARGSAPRPRHRRRRADPHRLHGRAARALPTAADPRREGGHGRGTRSGRMGRHHLGQRLRPDRRLRARPRGGRGRGHGGRVPPRGRPGRRRLLPRTAGARRRPRGGAAMTLVVKKFGGTSVGSPERIRAVAERVARARARGERVALVVSAMGDTTDELLALASAVAPGAAATRRRELDQLLATGEQAAIALVALALEECGVPAVSFTGPQAEIWTDGAHGAARITEVRASRVRRALEEGRVPVVAGFQGLSADEELTTLGRGGSDTTAVAIAIALGAARCDIYTDVDGIFSADPRRVPTAQRWDRLAHRETLMLALAGAAVLHPRAAALAESYRMPLRILSSLTNGPECGTYIDGG